MTVHEGLQRVRSLAFIAGLQAPPALFDQEDGSHQRLSGPRTAVEHAQAYWQRHAGEFTSDDCPDLDPDRVNLHAIAGYCYGWGRKVGCDEGASMVRDELDGTTAREIDREDATVQAMLQLQPYIAVVHNLLACVVATADSSQQRLVDLGRGLLLDFGVDFDTALVPQLPTQL